MPETSAGVTCSPRPRPIAVPPSSANATSLPTRPATSASSCWLSPVPHSSLQATSAAAASALPPASPAATGIRFLISMASPGSSRQPGPTASVSAATARAARLSPPSGTLAAPSPLTRTLSVSAGATVTSSNRARAWNTVTRSW